MQGFTPAEERLRRSQYTGRLRVLGDFLDRHLEVPPPAHVTGTEVHFHFWLGDARQRLEIVTRAFGQCAWDTRTWGPGGVYYEASAAWEGWRVVVLVMASAMTEPESGAAA